MKESPWKQLFIETEHMSLRVALTELGGQENLDINLDPDPEWLLICHMFSNTK